MIINHNIAALNTHRQLGSNNAAASKNLEKLSSGLKINRAGDDAAGLAISEKMRGQIRGLDMAAKNSQDSISLIQTAEGALNETHSILQRMRELSVQAGNDTNTGSDRGEIQKEMDQLKKEVDRIGNTTQFNQKNLIDGSQSQKAVVTTGATNIASAKATNAMDLGTYNVTVANTAKVAANVNDSGTGIDAAAKVTGFGTSVDVGDGFKVVISAYNAAGSGSATLTLQDKEGNQIGAAVNSTDLTAAITLGDTGANNTITLAANAVTGDGSSTFEFGVSADYTVSKSGVEIEARTGVVSTNGKTEIAGFELKVNNSLADGTNASIEVSGEALQMQIGANENQSIRVSVGDMRSEALGISGVNVSDHASAKAAITTIQTAIESVSQERSKLGATQNRLEHTINNLSTSSENLTAAESRIRDVDMAKEMMSFTKNNILTQAAQAMLAQANQQPQGVLQLLR